MELFQENYEKNNDYKDIFRPAGIDRSCIHDNSDIYSCPLRKRNFGRTPCSSAANAKQNYSFRLITALMIGVFLLLLFFSRRMKKEFKKATTDEKTAAGQQQDSRPGGFF
jgi:hypothetical protein